ncbi:MAG: hypothetical protein KME13_23930 [Myxacorys californica WJT36-NPBG1]|jgi:hypothetical protein|nr:hypothetical protein [Myxacorys californica WJT36-NPBG1]
MNFKLFWFALIGTIVLSTPASAYVSPPPDLTREMAFILELKQIKATPQTQAVLKLANAKPDTLIDQAKKFCATPPPRVPTDALDLLAIKHFCPVFPHKKATR